MFQLLSNQFKINAILRIIGKIKSLKERKDLNNSKKLTSLNKNYWDKN